MNLIDEQYTRMPFYGVVKMTQWLIRQGFPVNPKRVRRLMRRMGLEAIYPKQRLSISAEGHKKYPYLLRGLAIERPDQFWVADITYIRIQTAFVYLTVILDLFSRKAIGYALSRRIDTALSLQALRMAMEIRRPPAGVIHHFNQGVPYAAYDYVDTLRASGFEISMARQGNPYDNAVAESLMKTLKTEEVYLSEYRTLEDVQSRLPYFIEQVYNRKRLHSALGYRPPEEFESLWTAAQNHPVGGL